MTCFKKQHDGLATHQRSKLDAAGLLSLHATWASWCRDVAYPRGLPEELRDEGIELLDAEVAGCISTFFSLGGCLDADRRKRLNICKSRLGLLIAGLERPASTYFEGLIHLADEVEARLECGVDAS